MPNKISMLLICTLLILTLSCGGSSDGSSSDGGGNNNNGNDSVVSGEILNENIEGKFLINHGNGKPLIMDARTSVYTEIPNTHWADNDEVFSPSPLIYDYHAKPIRNNSSAFSVLAHGVNDSYVTMQDYSGNFLSQKLHLGEAVDYAAVSQDLRFIALSRNFSGYSRWFEIYMWDGTLVSDRELGKRSFYWLRDNRILYTEDRTIYFTKRLSTEVDYRLTLPDTGLQPGHIDTIAISPDDSQIAFTIAEVSDNYGTTLTNSRLYIANIDGSSVRLLATSYNDQDPRLTFPEWSPDGRWLYIQEGYGTVDIAPPEIPNIGTDNNRDMYIVPTEDLGKVFTLSTDDAKRSPEAKRFWRLNTIDHESGGVTGKASPYASFYWITP